jgi:hypothetical protein
MLAKAMMLFLLFEVVSGAVLARAAWRSVRGNEGSDRAGSR